MAHGGSAMAHGSAWPCFGLAGPVLMVAPSPEHLHMMEKARRELGKEERSSVVLATVSSNSGKVTVMVTASEMAKGPHLRLVWLSENINEVHGVLAELWAGYCWLWCSGELVRARRSNGNDGGPLRLLRKGEEK